jgi:mycothiol synthase
MTANDEPGLVMRRPNLRGLPPLELPVGYYLRHYQQGDEHAWNQLVHEGFNPHYDFNIHMKADPEFQPERVLFVVNNDLPVATASAWLSPKFGPHTGVIHMVAANSGYRGKRLGYWVSLAVLHRFVIEGRLDAMLNTNDFRLPAIKTYLNLGFEPVLVHENQRSRWNEILQKLNCLDLADRFQDILHGPLVCI